MAKKEYWDVYHKVVEGDLTEVRRLLTTDPSLCDSVIPFNFLSIAAEEDNVDMVLLLLEMGCHMDKHGLRSSSTPLNKSISKSNEKMARLLLEYGADPNIQRSVISAVVAENSKTDSFIRLLDEFGADLGKCFPLGDSDQKINALSMAIQWGNQDAVEYLKSRGVGIPEQTTEAETEAETEADDVVQYFEKHFGEVNPMSLIEIVPTSPQVAIRMIPMRFHTTLFTHGMSDYPMQVPSGRDPDFTYAELFIELPGEFPMSIEEWKSPEVGWPIEWLRNTATYPAQENTWLGGPVSIISNGEPATPIAPGLKFTGMLLLAEKSFKTKEGKLIQLYRLTPLYPEEQQLEKRKGVGALMRAFDRHDIGFIVDPNRKNVGLTPRPFNLFRQLIDRLRFRKKL